MLDFFWDLSNKDKFTFIGIVISAGSSMFTLFISLKLNKRSSYVNSITNERITSMTQLKQNTAEYISMLKYFIVEEGTHISVEKLYNLKLQIEFQLNSAKGTETLIIQRMDNIFMLINYLNNIKQAITVKGILQELTDKGINKERLPIPYTEETRLNITNAKTYLKRLIHIEVDLLEENLKKHINQEWKKIKSEV
ncbi:hypothetical protein [Bacillus cereus]|uniref:hypothetical protein n=1 Tax=Bacillus cereus TaxID=1396 RepID=UPI001F31D440|nr:hypothetical protein [Bacillus cereus]BCC29297.1 hypothetical protein BCM0100_2023 [Bacillus cereus]